MKKSVFHIKGMDCPSEEQLIRMHLNSIEDIHHLEFDIPARSLAIIHECPAEEIVHSLDKLKLGSGLISTEEVQTQDYTASDDADRRILIMVLVINALFFFAEVISGIIAESMGLIADGIDMLADALVYGLALLATGRAFTFKRKIAVASGYFQLVLALLGLAEVIRRFLGHGNIPDYGTMILVSILALAGNTLSLFLLNKSRSREVHIKASMIFTSNDIIANTGVIVAAILVMLVNSGVPDLVVGTLVFLMVFRGALRILKLGRT